MGLSTFIVILFLVAVAMGFVGPDQPMYQGVIYSFAGGLAGICGFEIAYLARGQNLSSYGLRPARLLWFAIAISLCVITLLLGQFTQSVYEGLLQTTGTYSKSILNATARADALLFLLSLFGIAILTPFGQELLFRGVFANALNRYGPWSGVGQSAAIFGVTYGLA